MNYLQTYKSFKTGASLLESGSVSSELIRKKNNEDYIELMNILQSEVFDDFGVVSKSDESFGEIDPWDELYPSHSFWAFRPKRKSSQQTTEDDFSDISLVETTEVEEIIVYNIKESDKERFWNLLIEVKDIVRSYLNKELVISEEYHEPSGNFDYLITLEKIK